MVSAVYVDTYVPGLHPKNQKKEKARHTLRVHPKEKKDRTPSARSRSKQVGLVNGIRGEVVELVYADDAPPPKLPLYVVVKFRGYSGREWSSQERYRGCVPISPVDTTWQDGGTQVRTQLPLRLCWAITMHKSQGQTLDKAVIDLGPKEACTGLSFVCLSRAKRLVDLIVEPMSFDRDRQPWKLVDHEG